MSIRVSNDGPASPLRICGRGKNRSGRIGKGCDYRVDIGDAKADPGANATWASSRKRIQLKNSAIQLSRIMFNALTMPVETKLQA